MLNHEQKFAVLLPDGDGEVVPGLIQGIQYPINPLQVTAMDMVVVDIWQFKDLAKVREEEARWEFMVAIASLLLPRAMSSPFNPIATF